MKRENVAYLAGGLAFGFLFGFGVFHTISNRPDKQLARIAGDAAIPAPAGPMAPTQVGQGPDGPGAQAGAPMLQEINSLKRTLATEPDNLPALTRLGNLYQDIGQWTQAIAFYEKALAVAPKDPDLLTDTGSCYMNLKDPQRALDLFDRAHRADPRHWQSLFNKAVLLGIHLGRLDEAEAALREVERIQPSVPEVGQLRQALEQVRGQRTAGS